MWNDSELVLQELEVIQDEQEQDEVDDEMRYYYEMHQWESFNQMIQDISAQQLRNLKRGENGLE